MKNAYKSYIVEHFDSKFVDEVNIEISAGTEKILILKEKWEIKGFTTFDHKRIFDLKSEENWSVLILVIKLFENGYTKKDIHLEKSWKLGHSNSGFLDVAIMQKGKPYHFIEVKKPSEINKYIDFTNSDSEQLFSYVWQAKDVKFASYYTFDPIAERDKFFTIPNINEIASISATMEDLIERWNKIWDESGIILNNSPFDSEVMPLSSKDLVEPGDKETSKIIHQFLTILRLSSVSDKSNAFDKMINVFIAKVYDERQGDDSFIANRHKISGTKFQFLVEKDDSISFVKRLNDLYKLGMKSLLKKDIVDYTDQEIDLLLGKSSKEIRTAFDNLRLKKNSAFSFVEVFDDKTFEENFEILKAITELLQNYKFTNESKSQFLGDFFEELLNNTWKQEAGQFFTPMPMVDFIINSLPLREQMLSRIENKEDEIIPKAIDYACGSGHFIISYMQKIDEIIMSLNIAELKTSPVIKNKLEAWKTSRFSWAGEAIFGIEKDYRLVKTTRVATFLNGDGSANIIHGSGIAKFSADDYMNTQLRSNKKKNPIFDYVIANPPYAVKGFENNLIRESITQLDFELYKGIPSGAIEILFIERTVQLLKNGAIAALVLPRSILSTSKYKKTREFIFTNTRVLAVFESGEISFGGTSTSPIILFLRKEKTIHDYNVGIMRSPKMNLGSAVEEKKWLGYEFSSNKHKLGITINNDNLPVNLANQLNNFIKGISDDKYYSIESEDIKVKNIKDVTFDEKALYMAYDPVDGVSLNSIVNDYCPSDPLIVKDKTNPYLEIGNLKNGKISGVFKNLKSNKTAKNGDILFPKLVGAPDKFKIVYADRNYIVSSAIAVLRIDDHILRDQVFNYLKNNENNILHNMLALGDGFKASYLKISDDNLLNNIKLNLK